MNHIPVLVSISLCGYYQTFVHQLTSDLRIGFLSYFAGVPSLSVNRDQRNKTQGKLRRCKPSFFFFFYRDKELRLCQHIHTCTHSHTPVFSLRFISSSGVEVCVRCTMLMCVCTVLMCAGPAWFECDH